jgi:hypothetical protein
LRRRAWSFEKVLFDEIEIGRESGRWRAVAGRSMSGRTSSHLSAARLSMQTIS